MPKHFRNTPRQQRLEIAFWSTLAFVLGGSIFYYVAAAQAAAKVAEYTAR
jgi:NhaP-type Na+/H+ or K+/H+ antiporter